MTDIARDGEGFVVPAPLLARVFRMTEDEVATAMRAGRMTSVCETGQGEDVGRWRLTFRHGGQACRFTVDATGRILKTARFPVGPGRQPPG
jgi:hypothetical protein